MKKILSIDGGGIKGVFPASFLASIEEMIDGKIADYFDLIVGTSTGGIIALGLGLGYSAKDILDFYEKFGPDIFKGNQLIKTLRRLGFSKYTHSDLREALQKTFGDKKLGESKTRLVIPALNLENGEVHVYKTSHHERFQRDYKIPVVDVAMSTSAAPTFFPTFNTSDGIPLIDGGLWANNPMGVAAVEGVGVLNWPKDSIRMLSVGCTTESLNVKRGRHTGLGLFYWGAKITDVFMASQSSASIGSAQLLIGHQNIKRVSPMVANKKFGLDTVKEINALKGLGASEARKEFPNINTDFFSSKVDVFIPYHNL